MATTRTCPVCASPMVESGVVDGLGLIYMCDNDSCTSHGSENDCDSCGHPTAYVWVPDSDKAAADEAADAPGRWERRCFDPLCNKG